MTIHRAGPVSRVTKMTIHRAGLVYSHFSIDEHRAGPVSRLSKMTIHRAGPVYSLVLQIISARMRVIICSCTVAVLFLSTGYM